MADLTVTAANVRRGSVNQRPRTKQAGEAIDAGEAVYLNTADDKYYLAINTSEAAATCAGISFDTVLADEYFGLQESLEYVSGATMVAGTTYYVSATAGKLAVFSDLISTAWVTEVIYANTTTLAEIDLRVRGTQIA